MHYSIDQEVSDELQQMLREIFQKREFPEEVQIYGCPGIKKEGRTTEGEEKETMEEMRTKLYIFDLDFLVPVRQRCFRTYCGHWKERRSESFRMSLGNWVLTEKF